MNSVFESRNDINITITSHFLVSHVMCQTHSSNLTDHFVRYTSTVLGWTHILALSSRCQRTNQDSSDQLILYCPVVNCSLSFAFWIDRSRFLLLQLICLRVCYVVLISLKQSPYSPWTSGISKAFSPRGPPLNRLFFFRESSLRTLNMVVQLAFQQLPKVPHM